MRPASVCLERSEACLCWFENSLARSETFSTSWNSSGRTSNGLPGGEPNKQAPIQTHGGNCVTDTFLRVWRDGLNRLPNLLKGVSMIGINTGGVLVDGLRFSIAWLHGSRKESFPAVSSLQFWNFDLLHLKHRFHYSFRFFGILVVQHVDQHSWSDLPRKTEFVLEPAARRFL